MIIATLAFYLFAFIAVASAVLVVTAKNPVHSVLWLILTFVNASGLFILLGAEFIGLLLIVVYVGAVMVLFLFVVMTIDLNTLRLREGLTQYAPFGVVVGLILLAELAVVGAGWALSPESVQTVIGSPTPEGVTNTKALGLIIYTDYAYLFQIAGLVLLVAMIGSIMLTHRRREGVRRQKVSEQLDRGRTVEIRKVTSRGGI